MSRGTIDPVSGARVLGSRPGAYTDGAEAYVAKVITEASDRSSASPELEAAVVDWASSCHFSPARANLLVPLEVGPSTRVLDLGGGTGPLARSLIDRGAWVTLVDSSLARARVAVDRCAGTGRLDVIVGEVEDLDPADLGTFDLVIGVGVFEYRGDGPFAEVVRARLGIAAALVAPGGALVVAIENQLGLKYLAGHLEDHLSLPWVGVEGYPAGGRAATPSRRALATALHDHGLVDQRWLFPYPDYKHPRVIVAEELYARTDGADIVEGLVRHPSRGGAPEPLLLFDERAAHGEFLRAGLGPDVANSFLVVASRAASGAAFTDPDTLAWHFGSDRAGPWRRTRRLRRAGGDALEFVDADGPGQRRESWLVQDRMHATPYIPGRALDLVVAEHLGRGEVDAAAALLVRWREHLDAQSEVGTVVEPSHPFLVEGRRAILPPGFLDVDLGNFVVDGTALVRVDTEWSASGPVDLVLVAVRALVHFATTLVDDAMTHPFGAAADRWSLARSLAGLAGLPAADPAYRRLPDAAAELSALTGAGGPGGGEGDPRVALARLPFSSLRRRLLELIDEAQDHDREADRLRVENTRRAAREKNLAARVNVLDQLTAERGMRVEELEARNALLEQELDRERRATRELLAQLVEIRRSERWRVGGVLVSPVHLVKRLLGRGPAGSGSGS